MVTPHRLVVVRHSKAEPYADDDIDRQLTEHGRSDARAAGVWLAEQGVTADAALVSAAVRARQTWEEIAAGAGWDIEPELDETLYSADEDTAMDLLAATDESVGTLVVVGHNPTMGMLAQLLDDGDGPAEAVDRLMQGYPTTAVTVFELPGRWDALAPGTARLALYEVGRG